MNCLTLQALYVMVKQWLEAILKVDWRKIYADDTLRGKIGFDEEGVRALAAKAEEEFRSYAVRVTADEAAKCTTVRDLTRLIWSKIPEGKKC